MEREHTLVCDRRGDGKSSHGDDGGDDSGELHLEIVFRLSKSLIR